MNEKEKLIELDFWNASVRFCIYIIIVFALFRILPFPETTATFSTMENIVGFGVFYVSYIIAQCKINMGRFDGI